MMINRTFQPWFIAFILIWFGGVTAAQNLSLAVKTYTATRVTEFYAVHAATPGVVLTEIVAVRDNGSNVTARRIPDPVTGADVYIRTVTDLGNKRRVVVDPLSESLVTSPVPKLSNMWTIKPTTSCPGEPAGEMLGYPVLLQQENIEEPIEIHSRTWRSPALGCAALREETRTAENGMETLKVSSVTHVVPGQPEKWLFEIPSSYTERRPTDVMAEQARRYPQRFAMPDPSRNQLGAVYDAARKSKN